VAASAVPMVGSCDAFLMILAFQAMARLARRP
jgi:hypothetical protein